MKMQNASIEEWRNLIDTALRFKEMAPWNWMDDEDIFGVENPDTGEIGYCCVMGAMGEHLALGVYLGNEGLESYYLLRENVPIKSSETIMHTQKCLMVSFEDRRFLQPEDYQIIKQLGYRFRGKNAWPKFQRFDPGFFPWFLDKDDVRFLTISLEQALHVCKTMQGNPALLDPPDEEAYLVRKPRQQNKKCVWDNVWVRPELFQTKRLRPPSLDMARIQAIKQKNLKHVGFVELDYFYLPQPVQEKPQDRPYFPVVHLFVDSENGFILSTRIEKSLPQPEEMLDIFLTFIEEEGIVPSMLLVQSEWLLENLKQVAEQFQIQLLFVESLSMLHEAKESMYQFWRKNL